MATKSPTPNGDPSVQDTSLLGEYLAASIDINEKLSYEKKRVRDIIEDQGSLKLPLGVFMPVEEGGEIQRLVDFEINPDVAFGKYSALLSSWESSMKNAGTSVTAIANFLAGKAKGKSKSANLAPVVSSVGGIEISQIVKLHGNSLTHFFENMYLADIITILLGIRIAVTGDEWHDYAVSYRKCPVPGCEQTNVGEILDISDIEITSYGHLDKPPLFHLELKKGFKDGVGGATPIKHLFLQPQKFGQLHIYDGQTIDERTLLEAMIVAMPESQLLADKRKPFSGDHYDNCHNTDIQVMTQALQYVQPGPTMNLSMQCACARDEEIEHSINWIRDLRSFLYLSSDLPANI